MRSKKLYIAMLIMVLAFMIGLYVVKLWFPEQFAMSIGNDRIIWLGEFIDAHVWIRFAFMLGIGLIFDFFYFGAVCRQKILEWRLLLIVVLYNVALNIYYCFAPVDIIVRYSMLVMLVSSCYMILLPTLFTNELLPLAVTYCVNLMSQELFIMIKDVVTISANANSLTTLLFALDNYLWMVICYLVFNIKNKDGEMGSLKPLYGKSEFYAKKKAKAEKKIAKQNEIIKACDEEIAKGNN